MEGFVKGNVVILLFPFSDLSSSRKRPAVVVANLAGDDMILAQITSSVVRNDEYSVSLEERDFKQGRLPVSSLIRPNKLFTADRSIISSKVGILKSSKIKEVEDSLINIFSM
jgi:mRNA interferase MazF